jgi:hypothetical protein
VLCFFVGIELYMHCKLHNLHDKCICFVGAHILELVETLITKHFLCSMPDVQNVSSNGHRVIFNIYQGFEMC